jgi:hypothetical protein
MSVEFNFPYEPWSRDEELYLRSQAPLDQLRASLKDTSQPDRSYALTAAAAIVRAEAGDDGRELFMSNRRTIQHRLGGYMFDAAKKDVENGKPDAAELLLVMRSAQNISPLRPYAPGPLTRRAIDSEAPVAATVTSLLGTGQPFYEMQIAVRRYVQARHTGMRDADDHQLGFNAGQPENELLAQVDLIQALGFYDSLSVERPDRIALGQFAVAQNYAGLASRGKSRQFAVHLPRWEITAMETYLDDVIKTVHGNRRIADIPSRPWRFLRSDGTGHDAYIRYLRGRERGVRGAENETGAKGLNARYNQYFGYEPGDLAPLLDRAVAQNDVEEASNIWTVLTQRYKEEGVQRIVWRRQKAVAELIEPDVLSAAKRVGRNWDVPKYVTVLLAQNLFTLKGINGISEVPSILSDSYGSLEEDAHVISDALSRWLTNYGASYRYGSSHLDLAAAYKIYAKATVGYQADGEGRRLEAAYQTMRAVQKHHKARGQRLHDLRLPPIIEGLYDDAAALGDNPRQFPGLVTIAPGTKPRR